MSGEETGDPLCCCEYINNNGERSHILAVCCDCDDLDESCERFFQGQPIGSARLNRVTETVLDRIRIPTFLGKGARRIDELMDLTVIPPAVTIPLWLMLASLHIVVTLVSFVWLLSAAVLYYSYVLRHKKRTQFFMSLTLVSIFSMYYVFSTRAVPLGHVSPLEHAALTINLFLFFGAFAMAKQGPGFVSLPDTRIPARTGNRTKLDEDVVNNGRVLTEPGLELHRRTNGIPEHLSGDETSSKTDESLATSEEDENSEEFQERRARISQNWCDLCGLVKPARAGHCRICGICVHRLDHHCVWLDCCIGRDNHRSFIVALVLFLLGGTWGAARAAFILYSLVSGSTLSTALSIIYTKKGYSIIFVSVLYATCACLPVLALLLQQCHLITHNWTYRERKIAPRRPGGREQLAELDRGFVDNWMTFLVGYRGSKTSTGGHASITEV
ncbi:palmitoyltransferase ZDHHC23-like [Diadema antillarum]|uniref:palmitoyltransferase ZDHHC23-like n=1 Tax=Diadema antillarum TaxID=105358 RepID=UPI003A86F423